MSPEVGNLVERMLEACADSENKVDVRTIADASFAILAWALGQCPDDGEREMLLATTMRTASIILAPAHPSQHHDASRSQRHAGHEVHLWWSLFAPAAAVGA
jgi:hypothetical protein